MNEARCPACGMAAGEGRYCRSCGLDLTAPARASAMTPVLYVEPGTHPPGLILAGRYRVHRAPGHRLDGHGLCGRGRTIR